MKRNQYRGREKERERWEGEEGLDVGISSSSSHVSNILGCIPVHFELCEKIIEECSAFSCSRNKGRRKWHHPGAEHQSILSYATFPGY